MMRFRFLVSLGLMGAIASSSFAAIEIFTGTLSGLNESPPTASAGTGTATVTLDTVTLMMRIQANFSGLTGNTTAAHIHARASSATPNGGVAVHSPSLTGFPLGVTSGSMDTTFDMSLASSYNSAYITANGGTPATAYAAFHQKMLDGLTYFNIHSTVNPGGEIRANLVLVPEPATMAVLGLGAFAALRRRRK